jgi:hypothetical protein
MPPAAPIARTATAEPLPAIDLLVSVAMFAMAATVVMVALLTVRDAAIESGPAADGITAADPVPFGLVAIVGWLLLEFVVRQLEGPSRVRKPHPVLILVRLTLIACVVLLVAGPVAQFGVDIRTWMREYSGL